MDGNSYMKMKEGFKEYLKGLELSHKSIGDRMRVFTRYQKWVEMECLEIENIAHSDLVKFMKHCQTVGASQRTIKHYMVTVKHFYSYLVSEGIALSNPATDIKVKGAKRKTLYHILEPHELNNIYNSYPSGTLQEKRNRAILGLFIYQGLHSEEVGKLTVKDIRLREGKIIVPGGIKRNGREMQLEAHQVMDLYDYILQVRPILEEMPTKKNSSTKLPEGTLFIGEGASVTAYPTL